MNDLASKTIIILVGVAIIVTGIHKYQEYLIKENFTMFAYPSCDPTSQTCFRSDCDESADDECDPSPYKKVEIRAYEAPFCIKENTCENFSCTANLQTCSEIECSEESLEEGETCTITESTEEESVTIETDI